MNKRVLVILMALIVAGCALLTSCQSAKAPETVRLGLELKNKSGKVVTEMYIYETGAADKGGNIIAAQSELIPDGKWQSGKGGVYLYGFVDRPVAETYDLEMVFEDGTSLIVPDMELLKPNSDGNLPNEISVKDAVDPDLTKIEFDDDAEVIGYINAAIEAGVALD